MTIAHSNRTVPCEQALISLAQQGDYESFTQLVRLYRGLLRGFLSNRHRSKHDIDDLFQMVWIRVWKSLARYRDQGQFSAWLLRRMATWNSSTPIRFRSAVPSIT